LRESAWLLCVAVFALTSAGCATYAGRIESTRMAVYDGELGAAAENIDALVARAEAGNRTAMADYPLLLLERASIYQMLGDHERAVADLNDADEMLEVLDLTRDPGGAAANYLWSDSRSLYQAPVYEKLMVNVCALASYLHMGDLVGARVEARRIEVMAEYFDNEERTTGHPVLAVAWYMAGITMELNDERPSALRFYLDAYALADLPGLAESLARLAQGTPFATNNEVLRAREQLGLGADDAVPPRPEREVIVLVMSGLPPIRQAVVLPIGVAMAAIRADVSSNYQLSSEQQAQLGRAMAEDLLTTVNYPELVVHQNPVHRISLAVGGHRQNLDILGNIEEYALQQWESQRAGIAFAAVVRALVRIVARETIQGVTRAADSGNGVAQTIGFIAGLAAQGAMAAADRPDTRTWTFMPAYVWMERIPLTEGEHTVVLRGSGGSGFEYDLPITMGATGTRVVFVRTPM
jgi:hypothetical protein